MLWILSYPRSGNHLLRTYIEYLTGYETLGCMKNELIDKPIHEKAPCKELQNISKNAIGRKAHKWKDIEEHGKSFDDLILLIRSPFECIPSHIRGMSDKNIPKEIHFFEKNIAFFQSFRGHKTILFYENLLQNPKECIQKIGRFLRLDDIRIQNTISNQTIIYQIALKALGRTPISHHDNLYYQRKDKIEYVPKDPYIQSILKRYF